MIVNGHSFTLEAFDVETAGVGSQFALQPWRATLGARVLAGGEPQAWLTSYATAAREDGEIGMDGELFPTGERLRLLLDRYVRTGAYVVGWNIAFDAAWLIALGFREQVFKIKWLDAMLVYKHLTNTPEYVPAGVTSAPQDGYGLKAAVAKFYPVDSAYALGVMFDFDAADYQAGEDLLLYNQLDAQHTLRLCEDFLDQLNPDQMRAMLIEAECIPLIADTMVNGIATDPDAAAVLSKKLEEDANLAFISLKLGISADTQVTQEILASPAQLRKLLFGDWGLPHVNLTEKGMPSTDKEALGRLAELDPRAKLIHDYREAKNNRTKFAEAVLESTAYNGDGCTRPTPRIFGTYTGRLTYNSKTGPRLHAQPTGVALHQWKRGKAFRDLLVAPHGYTLLEHDFAGQEFKWMAVESGDQTMLELCQPGEDPHAFMGARIGQEEYKLIQTQAAAGDAAAQGARRLGKVANLSLQYRTYWRRLQIMARVQYGVTLSDSEARAIWATYSTTYLGVPKYWRRQVLFAGRSGYVQTLAGRRVQLGDKSLWDKETVWSYESTAINFPIQGIGADQKYLALKVLRDYLPSVDGRFYYELHDGIFTVVPDRYAEKAAVEIKNMLSDLPYKEAWGMSFPIQFPVDAKMGKSWGSLVNV